MLNLLRMELRRIFRSKSIYIILAALIGIIVIALGTMKLVTSPALVDQARESGMEFDESDQEDAREFQESTQADFLSNLLFNGGLMVVLMAIFGSICTIEDFSTGFAKNVFVFHTKHSSYIISKLIMLASVAAFFLIALTGATILLFRVMGFDNPLGNASGLLLMFVIGWMGLTAFLAQNLFFCVATRNAAVSSILSIACGLGTVAGALDLISGLFGFHVAEFSPSYSILMAPYISSSTEIANNSILSLMLGNSLTIPAPVLSILVSAAWTVIYTLLASAVLKRKDIC